jgi:hypothetical protein
MQTAATRKRHTGIRTNQPRVARWADPGVNATMDAQMEAATFAGRDLRSNDPRADWVDRHPDLIDAYSEGQAYRYESECW